MSTLRWAPLRSAEECKRNDEMTQSYFPNTVYSEKCRSWYKMGTTDGRIVALWPGVYHTSLILSISQRDRFTLSMQARVCMLSRLSNILAGKTSTTIYLMASRIACIG